MKRIVYGSLSVLTAVCTVFVAAKAEVFSENRSSDPVDEIVVDSQSADLPALPDDLNAQLGSGSQSALEKNAGKSAAISADADAINQALLGANALKAIPSQGTSSKAASTTAGASIPNGVSNIAVSPAGVSNRSAMSTATASPSTTFVPAGAIAQVEAPAAKPTTETPVPTVPTSGTALPGPGAGSDTGLEADSLENDGSVEIEQPAPDGDDPFSAPSGVSPATGETGVETLDTGVEEMDTETDADALETDADGMDTAPGADGLGDDALEAGDAEMEGMPVDEMPADGMPADEMPADEMPVDGAGDFGAPASNEPVLNEAPALDEEPVLDEGVETDFESDMAPETDFESDMDAEPDLEIEADESDMDMDVESELEMEGDVESLPASPSGSPVTPGMTPVPGAAPPGGELPGSPTPGAPNGITPVSPTPGAPSGVTPISPSTPGSAPADMTPGTPGSTPLPAAPNESVLDEESDGLETPGTLSPVEPVTPDAPLDSLDEVAPDEDFPTSGTESFSSSDRLIGEGFSPFQLSYLAIGGGLKEAGIPGGNILLAAYDAGEVSAADIVDAGATTNRLGTDADNQDDYTAGVDRFLELLTRDALSE